MLKSYLLGFKKFFLSLESWSWILNPTPLDWKSFFWALNLDLESWILPPWIQEVFSEPWILNLEPHPLGFKNSFWDLESWILPPWIQEVFSGRQTGIYICIPAAQLPTRQPRRWTFPCWNSPISRRNQTLWDNFSLPDGKTWKDRKRFIFAEEIAATYIHTDTHTYIYIHWRIHLFISFLKPFKLAFMHFMFHAFDCFPMSS